MKLHESGENYLEAIWVLGKKNGTVRSIDVAHHLNLSKPSVSVAIKKLRESGFVEMGFDGQLSLTEKGLEVAQTMYERHTILTKLLVMLGVDEKIAAEDACRMEHVLSEESFAAMKAHLKMTK